MLKSRVLVVLPEEVASLKELGSFVGFQDLEIKLFVGRIVLVIASVLILQGCPKFMSLLEVRGVLADYLPELISLNRPLLLLL